MYLPGFVCGTSGLGDALGLGETRRLSFGPVKISKVLNMLLRMMIQHKSFDFPDRRLIFCKEIFYEGLLPFENNNSDLLSMQSILC